MNGPELTLTPERVEREYEWVRARAGAVVSLANRVRVDLGAAFETTVDPIDEAGYRTVIDDTFADGDRAVNAAALVALLRGLDVETDYPGFVVDEWLGRELAATIAGHQPLRLLAEATFHYADATHHPDRTANDGEHDASVEHADPSDVAGLDDLDAALAAGVQTRLPGWDWTATESPFAVDVDRE